jgi:transposase
MYTDIATRALVVTLKASAGKTTNEIIEITGLPKATINNIYARAIKRGFDPNERPIRLRDAFLADSPRSGRPTKQIEVSNEKIISKVRVDRYGRERSCADLAGALSKEGINIPSTTVWRILRQSGFRKTKPTRKPGLTK